MFAFAWAFLYYFGLCCHLVLAWETELLYCCSEKQQLLLIKMIWTYKGNMAQEVWFWAFKLPFSRDQRILCDFLIKNSRWLLTKICRMRFHNLCSSLYCRTRLPRSCFSCHDEEVACEIRSLPYYAYEVTTASAWAAKSAAVTGCRTASRCSNQEASREKSRSCHYSFRVQLATSSTFKKPFLLHQQFGSRILPNLQ